MKTFKWPLILFIISLIIAGCGGNTTFVTEENGDKNFRLISAEEYFTDGITEDRSVEIIYNDRNKKEYKEIDDFLIQYAYSSIKSKANYIEKSFAGIGADGLCTLVMDENRIVEKRFHLIDSSKSSVPEKTVLYFYDEDNNLVKEQHIDEESNVILDVFYRYAYSQTGKDEFILIEKHYVSNEDDIKAYFRYQNGFQKPVSIEYDVNGDYSIDYITDMKYDEYGNPIVADNCKYNNSGAKITVSRVVYVWDEGIGEEDNLNQIWDDNSTGFLQRYR